MSTMIEKICETIYGFLFSPLGSILVGIAMVVLVSGILRKILGKFSWIIIIIGIIFIAKGIIDTGMILSCIGDIGSHTTGIIDGIIQ